MGAEASIRRETTMARTTTKWADDDTFKTATAKLVGIFEGSDNPDMVKLIKGRSPKAWAQVNTTFNMGRLKITKDTWLLAIKRGADKYDMISASGTYFEVQERLPNFDLYGD